MRRSAGDIVEYCDRGLISIPSLTLGFSVSLAALDLPWGSNKKWLCLETKVGGQGRGGASGAM